MIKRMLSGLLAITVCMSNMLFVSAVATDADDTVSGISVGNVDASEAVAVREVNSKNVIVEYSKVDDTVKYGENAVEVTKIIVNKDSSMGSATGAIVIPSVDPYGNKVVGIASNAAKLDELPCGSAYSKDLANRLFVRPTVILSEGIEYIGESAFENFTMDSVSLPESLEYIGDNAFRNSFMYKTHGYERLGGPDIIKNSYTGRSINIGKNVSYVGENAFSNGGYNTVYFEDRDTEITIGAGAFSDAVHLKDVTLPSSLAVVAENVFNNSNIIERVHYYGSEDDFNNIVIENGNSSLSNANVIYNLDNAKAVKKNTFTPFDDSFQFSNDSVINFRNYYSINNADLVDNMNAVFNTQESESASQMMKMKSEGYCYAFSALSYIEHMGVISASDIEEGAEKIHDINLNDAVVDKMTRMFVSQNSEVLYNDYSNCEKIFFDNEDTNICYSVGDYRKDKVLENYAKIEYAIEVENEPVMLSIYLEKGEKGNSIDNAAAHSIIAYDIVDVDCSFNNMHFDKKIICYDNNDPGFTGRGFDVYTNTENGDQCMTYYCGAGYGMSYTNAYVGYVVNDLGKVVYKSQFEGINTGVIEETTEAITEPTEPTTEETTEPTTEETTEAITETTEPTENVTEEVTEVTEPTETVTTEEITDATTEVTEPNVIYGDVNLDGVVDIMDVITLQKYLLGHNTIINESRQSYMSADIDKDGVVDVFDLFKLKRKIVGLL